MTTGAQRVVKALEECGVECTFGIPGAQILELVDALVDANIRNVLTTSELSAAFMADGYARASGRTGVCIAIPGPGFTNMITGLAEAYLDSSPVVVLVIGMEADGKAFHVHEIAQLDTAKPVTKATVRVDSGDEIDAAMARAFGLAEQGEPGPVVVEIARKCLRERVPRVSPAQSGAEIAADPGGPPPKGRGGSVGSSSEGPDADGEVVGRIARMLSEAKHCGIYAGKGAWGAHRQVRELAELLGAPVATTVSGKGVLPEDHELAVGFGFGPSGSAVAEEVFAQCDVVLALGCKFGEMSTAKWGMEVPAKLIHIDTNPAVFDKNYPAAIAMCKDAKLAVEHILRSLKAQGVERRVDSALVDNILRAKRLHVEGAMAQTAEDAVHPSRLLMRLRDIVGRGAVVVTDCGNHQLWAISDCQAFEPRTFLTPADYQAMGFGVPAAIGAGIGCPHKRVVCICGDGGFLMTGFELLTAVREGVDVSVIVFNDGALGLIKGVQEKVFGRSAWVDLVPLNYESLAAAMGVNYVHIHNHQDLAQGLRQMHASDKPVLVNVNIAYDNWPKHTEGAVKSQFKRLPLKEKLSLVGRRAQRMIKNRG